LWVRPGCLEDAFARAFVDTQLIMTFREPDGELVTIPGSQEIAFDRRIFIHLNIGPGQFEQVPVDGLTHMAITQYTGVAAGTLVVFTVVVRVGSQAQRALADVDLQSGDFQINVPQVLLFAYDDSNPIP
jgi:hypothetical protein